MSAFDPTPEVLDRASGEIVKCRSSLRGRLHTAAVRMVPIWFAGLCGMAIAERILDGDVEWNVLIGLAVGGLVGVAAIAVATAPPLRWRRVGPPGAPLDDGCD